MRRTHTKDANVHTSITSLEKCQRKREYETRHKARISAERAGAVHNRKFRYYRCPHCRYFHLTSQPARKK